MFSQERAEYFRSLPKAIRINLSVGYFMKSEILFIIDETPLSERDRTIAIKRFTERMTYEGITVPYATTKATIGTASTEVHALSLTGIVRVLPNAPVTIAISNGGVPVTATMTSLKAIKIG